jgi:broad specificity phosphatase PhoE
MTRTVEIRRHSYTKKGEERGRGSHLSADGIQLARRIGETMGAFARVLVSDVPRTLETAVAMGFAVDDALPFPDEVSWGAVIDELGWHALWDIDQPFAHLAEILPSRPQAVQMGQHYAGRWLAEATSVPDGHSALVISHGQLMEVC